MADSIFMDADVSKYVCSGENGDPLVLGLERCDLKYPGDKSSVIISNAGTDVIDILAVQYGQESLEVQCRQVT
jgi:hypothetical protein